MRKEKSNKTVVLSLWLAGSAGRKQLSGALRYVNTRGAWNFRLFGDPSECSAEALGAGIDGFLGHVTPDNADALLASDIPAVIIDFPPPALLKRRGETVILLDDDERIGQTGADYFVSLGRFAAYAFVPDAQNRGWSRLRERGYRRRLAEHGLSCPVYRSDRQPLADWLKGLPKPAAVLCAYDFGAKEVLDCCHAAQIDVPRQIAVLGVDNDELVCDNTTPSLSSIRLDHEHIGFRAAEELNRRMCASGKRRKAPYRLLLPDHGVVERASTRAIPPAVLLTDRINDFIREHAAEPIDVRDIVSGVGVSRRLADLRYRERTGSSIRQALENRRLELVCRRLRTGDLSLDKIACLCGYANPQRLKYVFKARFGVSMSAWREAAAKPA